MKKLLLSTFTSILLATNVFGQAESDIVITEIFYNAPGSDTLEFVELYNKSGTGINLTGFYFNDGINFTFPSFTLNAGEYVVITNDSNYLVSNFTIPVSATVYPWDSSSLDNAGEDIVLVNTGGTIMDSVRYNDKSPWSTFPDGNGGSLVLCDPTTYNQLGYNWSTSINFAGSINGMSVLFSPGAGEGFCSAPGEVFPPEVEDVDVPSSTSILIEFNEPVGPSAEVLGSYTGVPNITSAARDGSLRFVTLTLSTPFVVGMFDTLYIDNVADTAGNAMTMTDTSDVVFNNTTASLVITEILYNNPGSDTLEFIEILNNGSSTAQLGGYRFNNGITYKFPTMTLNAGEYVVVARYPNMVNAFFGISGTLGWTSGGLSNGGEKLSIENTSDVIIDSLTYSDTIPWPNEGDGFGSSIILCDPNTDNSLYTNWSFSTQYVGNLLGAAIFASPKAANTCPVGIFEQPENSFRLSVFPNPTFGAVTFNPETISDYNVVVTDVLGKKAYEASHNNTNQISISLDRKGVYFAFVTDLQSGKVYTASFIVE